MKFCKDCMYLGEDERGGFRCNHPTNVIEEERSDWYTMDLVTTYKQEPSVLNQNNDCGNHRVK